MTAALRIIGSGMCCPVGFTAPAARAAIRAGLDRFKESSFLDTAGAPIIVASLPLGDVWGPRRLSILFESAYSQCIEGADLDLAAVPVLLVTPEPGRPGSYDTWGKACLRACEERVGRALHPASRVLPRGRAGVASALVEARAILAEKRASHVVVGGVDSYLNAHAINHFLRRERLLAAETKNGFIPGEGAGALLVELAPRTELGLFVSGIGVGDERATFDNDIPVRGVGLTHALRAALAESGCKMSDLHFRMADIAGEAFFFNDAGLAVARAFDRPRETFPTVHITDSIGETGAAIGPLSIAYLAGAMPRGHVPGTRAVFHLAGDRGARAALVIEHMGGVSSGADRTAPSPPKT